MPINSNDPAANAAIAVFLAFVAVALVVVGGMFLLPVVVVIALAKGIHWYANRPTPTDQLYAHASQRTIAANVPDADKFLDAHLERFLEVVGDNLPTFQLYVTMARITDLLYRDESLYNPLPPLIAPNTIEEGRYRDQILLHQRKMLDAPRTLQVFNDTLGNVYVQFISYLPRIAKSTLEDFEKCGEVETFATFPLIDMLPSSGEAVLHLMSPFFAAEVEEVGLFENLRKQLGAVGIHREFITAAVRWIMEAKL